MEIFIYSIGYFITFGYFMKKGSKNAVKAIATCLFWPIAWGVFINKFVSQIIQEDRQ